jgi:hypothetical protein
LPHAKALTMDGIKYQLAVISDQLAVHAGVLFF